MYIKLDYTDNYEYENGAGLLTIFFNFEQKSRK